MFGGLLTLLFFFGGCVMSTSGNMPNLGGLMIVLSPVVGIGWEYFYKTWRLG